MLATLMVKTAQTDAIPLLVASAARAIEDVVDLEIAARGTPGRHAAPAVAHQDRIVGDVVGAVVRVPGGDEVLDEREEPDPRRDPAAADGKRPSGKKRGGRRIARPVGVPRDRLDLFGDPLARDLDCGEETSSQIVGERQAKENIRLRDEGAGGTERGRGWRRGRRRDRDAGRRLSIDRRRAPRRAIA